MPLAGAAIAAVKAMDSKNWPQSKEVSMRYQRLFFRVSFFSVGLLILRLFWLLAF